jgi:hypothetical protein
MKRNAVVSRFRPATAGVTVSDTGYGMPYLEQTGQSRPAGSASTLPLTRRGARPLD